MNAVLLEKWKGVQSFEPAEMQGAQAYDFCEKKS